MDDLPLVPVFKPISRKRMKEIAATMWEFSEEEARWAIEWCRDEAEKATNPTDRRYWIALHKDYIDVYGSQATDMMKTEVVAEQIAVQGQRTFAPNSIVPPINGSHRVTILPKDAKEKEEACG